MQIVTYLVIGLIFGKIRAAAHIVPESWLVTRGGR